MHKYLIPITVYSIAMLIPPPTEPIIEVISYPNNKKEITYMTYAQAEELARLEPPFKSTRIDRIDRR